MLLRRSSLVIALRTTREFGDAIMRYFCCFFAVALCEAMSLANAVEHPYFQNFRSVYHGNGATSYQNVDIDNHGSVPISKNYRTFDGDDLHLESEHGIRHDIGFTGNLEEGLLGEYNYGEQPSIPVEVSYGAVPEHVDHIPNILPEYYEHNLHDPEIQQQI